LKKLFRETSLYLLPAGGSMDKEIQGIPFPFQDFFINQFKKFNKIYPENQELYSGLEKIGFKNLSLFPNPRKREGYKWSYNQKEIVKIIFLSSIRKGKGPLLLIDSIKNLLENGYEIEV